MSLSQLLDIIREIVSRLSGSFETEKPLDMLLLEMFRKDERLKSLRIESHYSVKSLFRNAQRVDYAFFDKNTLSTILFAELKFVDNIGEDDTNHGLIQTMMASFANNTPCLGIVVYEDERSYKELVAEKDIRFLERIQ